MSLTPRDRAAVDDLLRITSTGDLLEYFGLEATDSAEAFRRAIEARCAWAQGQQTDPKHRSEALWVIANQGTLERVLLEERPAYLASLALGPGGADLQGFLPGPPKPVVVDPVHGLDAEAAEHTSSAREATPGDPRAAAIPIVAEASGPLRRTETAPKIQLVGEELRRLHVGWDPWRFTVDLANAGRAPMCGRVSSAWAWLEVRPNAFVDLEPGQTVSFTAVIFPRLMPSRTAEARITVAGEHGERRTLDVRATRPLLSPGAQVTAAVAIGAGAVAALAWFVPWAHLVQQLER